MEYRTFYFLSTALLAAVAIVEAGNYCQETPSTYSYCSDGCCGYRPYEYCCSYNYSYIAGIVIGSIFIIAVVVGIVVYCIKKKNRTKGVVVQAPTSSQPAFVSTTVVQGRPSPAYAPGQAPNGAPFYPGPLTYLAPVEASGSNPYPPPPPPAYAGIDPAYPPVKY